MHSSMPHIERHSSMACLLLRNLFISMGEMQFIVKTDINVQYNKILEFRIQTIK